jgi:tRNA-specific 2-thiouridylase
MMKPIPQTRVIVGLSGGVDSSVAALLLKKQGYRVEGVFMQNWDENGQDNFCPADVDLKDAERVCKKLDIPFHTISFAKEYWERVFQYFLEEYAAGHTPNPDILCNKEIKFKAFLDYALAQGADYIATGHYVRSAIKSDKYQLLKAHDLNKDQSYFLYTLQSEQLAKSLFPIGEFTKPAVRKIAEAAGFENHAKKDSTGICFIGERRFSDFLGEYLLARPGDIETTEGKVIGRHNGLMFYTLGQRQGLGIGGQKGGEAAPWYVIEKDTTRQVLIVAQSHDHPKLLSSSLRCRQLHWVAGHPPETPLSCSAKTRYRQMDAACVVNKISADEYEVVFDEPQWAVTPGQSVVFYDGIICLGGGVII